MHKYHNPKYHDADTMGSHIMILTDHETKWRSEINTVNNDVPWQTHSGYYETMRITKTLEKDVPTYNKIVL